jgi:hypothetical protein
VVQRVASSGLTPAITSSVGRRCGASRWRAVLFAAGERHWSSAVLADGVVLTCGANDCDQLLDLPVFGGACVILGLRRRSHAGGDERSTCGYNLWDQIGHGNRTSLRR